MMDQPSVAPNIQLNENVSYHKKYFYGLKKVERKKSDETYIKVDPEHTCGSKMVMKVRSLIALNIYKHKLFRLYTIS